MARPESAFIVSAAAFPYPECSRMTKSPISCGISCAMIAVAVTIPSCVLSRKAAAMSTPSTKLWNPPPMVIMRPLRPWSFGAACRSCASQSSTWQWRHSTSFSSTKNARMPARMVAATDCTWSATANACGRMSRKTAPSSAPIAKLISPGIQLDRAENAMTEASAKLSTPPPKLATEIHATVPMGGSALHPDQARHSAGDPVPAKGEEARVARRAEAAAVDAADAAARKPSARERGEVGQELAAAERRESVGGAGVAAGERLAHVAADLVRPRPDRGPEPCEHAACRHAHRGDRGLDDACAQAAPSGVRHGHDARRVVAKQHRHAVGDEHRAHFAGPRRHRGVGLDVVRGRVRAGHARSMHLFHPARLGREAGAQDGPVAFHAPGFVADARAEV